MTGVTLDAGALIALDRGDRRIALLLDRIERNGGQVAIPTTVIAQTIRKPDRQVRLGLLLRAPLTEIVDLDAASASAVGQLLGATRSSDIADAHVALTASGRGHAIVTSDPDDLAVLAPHLPIIEI